MTDDIPELLDPKGFVGQSDVARLVGVSAERVRQLKSKREADVRLGRVHDANILPWPVYISPRGDEVYRVADVRAWCERTGRTFHDELLREMGGTDEEA